MSPWSLALPRRMGCKGFPHPLAVEVRYTLLHQWGASVQLRAQSGAAHGARCMIVA